MAHFNFQTEKTAMDHFKKAMETKYAKEWGSNKQADDIQAKTAKYLRLGTEQNPRKMEMTRIGAEITKKRGLQAYDPKLHLAGIPLGQRQLTPYTLGGTDLVCDGDDLHYVNNSAMQQLWDDIRRTCVVGLDLAHETLEKRLGKKGIGVNWSETAESADVSVRFVEIDKGNQFLRYMLPFIAPAVVEVEGHVSPGGSSGRPFHFVQKAQVGILGGGAKSMLTVCASAAADKISKEILKVV